MSGERNTKTVFRLLMAWSDEKTARWLSAQERAGWRLRTVGCFLYTFEKVSPSEVSYRLDFGPSGFGDRTEYFGLFRDAGWEHVGRRGLWQFFRKEVVNGQAPQIHTDPQSRIAMYRRVVAFLALGIAVLLPQAVRGLGSGSSTALTRYPAFLVLELLLITLFAYGIGRLLLVIVRLKREPGTSSHA